MLDKVPEGQAVSTEDALFSGQGNSEQVALVRAGLEEGLTWSQLSHIFLLSSGQTLKGPAKNSQVGALGEPACGHSLHRGSQRLGRKGVASNTNRVSGVSFLFCPKELTGGRQGKGDTEEPSLPPLPERKERELDFPHFRCPGP